ncbi:MAG: universal stress protein [Burkholderiales bacterium]
MVDLAAASDQHAAAPAAAPALRVLLAADGSDGSLRAVGRFIDELPMLKGPVAVDLLNVQAPVSRDVSNFVDEDALKDLHHEEGMKALQPARALLERAAVPCTVHIGVGDFAHVVAHYARELGAAQVFLTETERSEGEALGEVVTALVPHVGVPVNIVR